MTAETIADRLRSLVPDRQKSESARKCGIAQKTFSSYLDGTEPTASKLVQLANGLGVNLLWLATGDGEKFPNASVGGEKLSEQSGGEPSNVIVPDDTIEIPRLDIRASAGAGAFGAIGEVIEFMPFPRAWLKAKGLNPAAMRIVDVAGDSMEPTLSDGDIIMVDTSVKRIRKDALYVIVRDDEVFVKRGQRRLNGSVLITSDNERYPPEEFSEADADRLRVAGRVAWYGRSI